MWEQHKEKVRKREERSSKLQTKLSNAGHKDENSNDVHDDEEVITGNVILNSMKEDSKDENNKEDDDDDDVRSEEDDDIAGVNRKHTETMLNEPVGNPNIEYNIEYNYREKQDEPVMEPVTDENLDDIDMSGDQLGTLQGTSAGILQGKGLAQETSRGLLRPGTYRETFGQTHGTFGETPGPSEENFGQICEPIEETSNLKRFETFGANPNLAITVNFAEENNRDVAMAKLGSMNLEPKPERKLAHVDTEIIGGEDLYIIGQKRGYATAQRLLMEAEAEAAREEADAIREEADFFSDWPNVLDVQEEVELKYEEDGDNKMNGLNEIVDEITDTVDEDEDLGDEVYGECFSV